MHLRQEDLSNLCTQDGNTNKGCYLPPDTYLSNVYVTDHPGYRVRQVTHPWTHSIWCDDMHISSTYVCFTTQGRLLCFPKPCFYRTRAHHLRRLVYKNLK